MNRPRSSFACSLCVAAVLALTSTLPAAERTAPPRLTSAPGNAFTDAERQAVVSWAMAQPEVRTKLEGRKTRVLGVESEFVKPAAGASRRATILVRDYDAGVVHEITADLSAGRVAVRDLLDLVQPNAQEIEQAMAIVRRDSALEAFVRDPRLTLMGGFFNRSPYGDDPCSREICLEFQFMRASYEKGPVRGVIVNLSQGVVAHHDFRATGPGKPAPRMTEKADQ